MPRTIRTKKLPAINAGTGFSDGYYDAFSRKRLPTKAELVDEYKQIIFTCAELNANACCNVPRKLYLKTESNSKQTILRKGTELKPVSKKRKDKLFEKASLQAKLKHTIDIEEVVEHPVLDLLKKPNSISEINGYELNNWTYQYLDVTGVSYWFIETNKVGLPTDIWLIPSQYIQPIKEDSSKNLTKPIDYYQYTPPGISNEFRIPPEYLTVFKHTDLRNPYGDGLSPVAAEYTSARLSTKMMSLQEGILDKNGIPDVVLSPADKESAFSPELAKRFEDELNSKFSEGKGGGFWVPSEAVNAYPLSVPIRDMARLEIGDIAKGDLSAAFGIPYALVSRISHNRQQLEAAEVAHAKRGVAPRLDRTDQVYNDRLLSFYDETGRLFFASDDPVPENKENKLKEVVQLVMNGVWTVNEGRDELGYPPIEGGDELRPINVSPEMLRQDKRDSGESEK